METTLVILAAGMASRYGGMKQVEGFGPNGETIMDYSIYDAIKAGFTKVVFIIREEFAEGFKANFEPKLAGKIATAYVYQKLTSYIGNTQVPADRVKPWGTAHALLCCKEVLDGPFAVINADDYYGFESFQLAANFLQNKCSNSQYALIGYSIGNTLSENGSVSRGVCEIDADGNLVGITERTNVFVEEGKIIYDADGEKGELTNAHKVSMNFFCFGQGFIQLAEEQFAIFLEKHSQELKSEFYIPKLADFFMKTGLGKIEVVATNTKWFGVTYKEDAEGVRKSIHDLVSNGTYPASLWS